MRSSHSRALVDRRALGRAIGRNAEHAEERIAGREHQRVVLGDQEVLQHRHAGKQPDVLEGARDPRRVDDQKVGHAFEGKQRAVRPLHTAAAAVGQRIELVPQRGIAVTQPDAAGCGL